MNPSQDMSATLRVAMAASAAGDVEKVLQLYQKTCSEQAVPHFLHTHQAGPGAALGRGSLCGLAAAANIVAAINVGLGIHEIISNDIFFL